MKKDIEKYINDNINAELPESLSKENIVSKLDRTPVLLENKSKKKSSKVLKFVSVAAAFAIVLSGVAIWKNSNKGVIVEPNSSSSNEAINIESYDEIYKQMKVLHQKYNNSVEDRFFAKDDQASSAAPESFNSVVTGNSSPNEMTKDESAFGTTNTQEKGIDEGDIIKTDGKNIYLASHENNVVYITSAEGNMKLLSKVKPTKTDASIHEIYLQDNRLVVVYSVYNEKLENSITSKGYYDCCCIAWVCSDTYIEIYDVTDAKNPKMLSNNMQSGHYISSRIINGKLYVVTSFGVNVSAKDYKENCIPKTGEVGSEKLIPCDKISLISGNKSPTYAVINIIDIKSAKSTASSAIFCDPTDLYATEKSIYILESFYDNETFNTNTKIIKYAITENGTEFVAIATVTGRINDTLSVSEQGDNFRIATTYDNVQIFGSEDDATIEYSGESNALYIFNKDMKEIGKIQSFAKDESIRSVRYFGNFAYVVTFRQTDPLFVIDLTDSTNPKIVGKVKLPGFSSYLHPFGNGYLIGVGQDGTETGINSNMKVSLFSVKNPEEPKEINNLKVSSNDGYVSSDVTYSYKSFVNLPNNEFAVPYTVTNSGSDFRPTTMFIRYKVENGEIKEVARYVISSDIEVSVKGGTYIGNYFFAYSVKYIDSQLEEGLWKVTLTKFDLNTNEKVNSITVS